MVEKQLLQQNQMLQKYARKSNVVKRSHVTKNNCCNNIQMLPKGSILQEIQMLHKG
jgi:hypothetical protein